MVDTKLLMIPSIIKAGKLYSILPEDGSGDFTVSRNSPATYIDENGNRQTSSVNEPRIDFSGSKPVLLIEPYKQNRLSTDITSWSRYQTNVTDLGDGVFRVSRLTEGWASYLRHSGSPQVGDVVSIKAKYEDVRYLVFLQTYTDNNDFSIDLINGTVAYNRNDTTQVTARMQDDGWVDIEFTYPSGASSSYAPYMQLNASATGMTNSNPSNIGSCLLKEPQLELGERTSFINSGTREADIITAPVPTGVTQIKEIINGTENIITDIPVIYQLPIGRIEKIEMT